MHLNERGAKKLQYIADDRHPSHDTLTKGIGHQSGSGFASQALNGHLGCRTALDSYE